MNIIARLATITALFAFSAFSANITFTNLPTTTFAGHYTGYVAVDISDSNASIDAITQIICDDMGHNISIPSGPWQYAVSTLDTLTNVRFTGPNQLLNYRAAAILLDEYDFFHQGGPLQADYQDALWILFGSPGIGTATGASLVSSALAQAAILPTNSAVYSQFVVFTPTQANPGLQEMLGIRSVQQTGTETPEPATMAVVGAILVGFGVKRFKRS